MRTNHPCQAVMRDDHLINPPLPLPILELFGFLETGNLFGKLSQSCLFLDTFFLRRSIRRKRRLSDLRYTNSKRVE